MNPKKKSLAYTYPNLVKEWHTTKNGDLSPTDVVPGSGKKVWWQCLKNKDHIWFISPDHRTRGNSGCPYCSFKRVHITNTLQALHPKLANEWDAKRNEKKPDQVTARHSKKVYWLCKKGHSFIYSVRQRTIGGLDCPYCAKRKASKDFNVFTTNPELEKEWHPIKNKNISSSDFLPGTQRKVWWKCKNGHEWETSVVNRTKGKGCPFCTSRKLDRNYSLGVRYPNLLKEWHPTKNDQLTPYDIHPNYNREVWWQCQKAVHHEWSTAPKNRLKSSGCPFCTGRRVAPENSLEKRNPSLAKEWNSTKNHGKTPSDFTANSNKKVWWKCEFNHEWQASISNRNKGRGCPDCTLAGTSLEEQLLFNSIKRVFSDAENRVYPIEKRKFETDIFIPSLNLIIEYDGVIWHSKSNVAKRDKLKNYYYEKNGMTLIRIREKNLPKIRPYDILYDYRKNDHSEVLRELKDFILLNFNEFITVEVMEKLKRIDKVRKIDLYYSKARFIRRHSLLKFNPTLAKEWHNTKNGDLQPDMIAPYSERKVWWQCQRKKHHEWEASPNVRSRGMGCPYCSHRRASKETCLLTVSPKLAVEWHPTKNGDLAPHSVLAYSNKKVWWQCKNDKEHVYKATINNRHSAGCPYCSGKKVSDNNRLEKLNPGLAKEWHPTKNRDLTPYDVSFGTHKKVWWLCNQKHEWQASVYSRYSGLGCPYCSGLYVIKNNSLADTHPKIAKEWHLTRNKGLTPNDVSFGSGKVVWWKGACGHEWEATVYNRSKKKGTNCPYCFGIGRAKQLDKNNNLATLFPNLANEWHPKNKTYPYDYSPGSRTLVWWKGMCGHEWEASIAKRSNGRGCPYCSGRKVGETNCLEAKNPGLTKEWHPTKNGKLTPRDVTQGSGKRVWWLCNICDYEWEALINNRNKGRGCPRCAGKVK